MCISAHGKSSVYELIRKNRGRKILAIVDGAAFGSEVAKVTDWLCSSIVDCTLYAPESFEYLILLSGLIDAPESVTTETYNYADSLIYSSWEEFYTRYLMERTRDKASRYAKAKLAPFYRTEKAVEMIKSVLPPQLREKSKALTDTVKETDSSLDCSDSTSSDYIDASGKSES